MWDNLCAFYNSKEWRCFRDELIARRTNPEDGIIYDEFSGKPLTRAYDIVLHHKIPLTVANVNDYNVSLNPDNIMIVSQSSHNEIHSRFGYTHQRKVYYIYGAPCSGKTTFVNNIKGNSDLVIDMDNIWQCVTGGARYEKPNALKSTVFTVRDCLFDLVKTRAGRWEKCYIITGGAVKGIREREIEMFGAEPIFIDTDMDTCLKRLYKDQTRTDTQRKDWETYIKRWFDDYIE